MTEREIELFHQAYANFETGNRLEALQELRGLSQRVHDPWDKTELLYHETLWLLDLDEIGKARRRLQRLRNSLESLMNSPIDDHRVQLPISLTVMTEYAEVRVLLAEKKEPEALRSVESLLSNYPKQLSTPEFGELYNEIMTHYGLLLANTDRCAEAKSILENVMPPAKWKGVVCGYLGYCYYMLRDYEHAEHKLSEALTLGLHGDRKANIHYTLGIVKYHLNEVEAAKRQFELCAEVGGMGYLITTRIWEWLEETSRVLGEYEEAEKYRRKRGAPLGKSKLQ